MKIVEKETGMFYDIFDVTYDKNGYPQFLIYKNGQWLRKSAKHFTPVIKNEETILKRSKDGKDLVAIKLLHS